MDGPAPKGVPLNERVLVIVTIIAQYILSDLEFPAESDLVNELLASGFAADEINAAFLWMERLNHNPRERLEPTFRAPTYRVFAPEESRLLSLEARGFLVHLRMLGLIDEILFEEMIEKAISSARDELGLEEIKSVAVQILATHAQSEWSNEIACILDDDWSGFLH
jgi:Smg protein